MIFKITGFLKGQFNKALDYVGAEFEEKIKYYALNWWPARASVQEAINKRFEVRFHRV